MAKNNDLGLLILRVALGLLMLLHGIAKLQHGVGFISGMLSDMGMPGVFAYGVFVGEIIAPIMLIVGFRTRIAAILLAITMLVAAFTVHSNDFFNLAESGGWAIELVGLFFFGSIALICTGGGQLGVSTKNSWD